MAIPFLKTIIDSMGWGKLCEVPKEYNDDWVREFYTKVAVSNKVDLKVRQTKISYSPKAINAYLGITPPEDSEFDRMQDAVSDKELSTILTRLTHEGSTWTFKGRSRTLRTCFLKPETNIWFYFLRHTLHPTSHDTDICMERVFIMVLHLRDETF